MAHTRRNSRPPEHLRLCHIHYPANITRRLERIDEPHVAPLNGWVRRARRDPRLPAAAGPTIPWFDPESAGIHARVLLLLQDPSAVAANNQFISPYNCDDTARNTWDACEQAGLTQQMRCHWNVFPWWVNTDGTDKTRPKMSLATAAPIAARVLPELLSLFQQLEVIVVAGTGTYMGWEHAIAAGLTLPADVRHIVVPSLSALGGFPQNRAAIVAELTAVANSVRRPPRAAGGEDLEEPVEDRQ